jgi:hypothetical protein
MPTTDANLVARLREKARPNTLAQAVVEKDDLRALLEQNDRLERDIARRDRMAATSQRFWIRAAKAAMAGDLRELRNRVDLAEAPPVEVVLSARNALEGKE